MNIFNFLKKQIKCIVISRKYLLPSICIILCGGLQTGEASDKAEASAELADIVAKGKNLYELIPPLMEKTRAINSLPGNSRDVILACAYVSIDSVCGVFYPIDYCGDVVADFSKVKFPKNGEWQITCRVIPRKDIIIDLSTLQNAPISALLIAGGSNFTSSSQLKNLPRTKLLGIVECHNLKDYSFYMMCLRRILYFYVKFHWI